MSVRVIMALRRTQPPIEIHTQVRAVDFPERIANLRASAAEHLEGMIERQGAWVVCDGCGQRLEVDVDRPQLPFDWVAREDGEFCEMCQ